MQRHMCLVDDVQMQCLNRRMAPYAAFAMNCANDVDPQDRSTQTTACPIERVQICMWLCHIHFY